MFHDLGFSSLTQKEKKKTEEESSFFSPLPIPFPAAGFYCLAKVTSNYSYCFVFFCFFANVNLPIVHHFCILGVVFSSRMPGLIWRLVECWQLPLGAYTTDSSFARTTQEAEQLSKGPSKQTEKTRGGERIGYCWVLGSSKAGLNSMRMKLREEHR